MEQEREIRNQEYLNALVSSSIEGGVMVCRTDEELRIIFANQKLRELLGYEAGEMDGLSVHKIVVPEEWESVLQEYRRQIVHGGSFEMEYRVRRKDGSRSGRL